ncbi:hypothetical protein UlMin_010648 [Ulmus minor]
MKITFCSSYVLVLLLVAWLFMSSSLVRAKYHVNLTNGLAENSKLIAHCQSKENDLGTRELYFGDSFDWKFTPNVWGTTLFYCDVSWNNLNLHFDIFKTNRDWYRCVQKEQVFDCRWIAQEDGFYFYNRLSQSFELEYPWPR